MNRSQITLWFTTVVILSSLISADDGELQDDQSVHVLSVQVREKREFRVVREDGNETEALPVVEVGNGLENHDGPRVSGVHHDVPGGRGFLKRAWQKVKGWFKSKFKRMGPAPNATVADPRIAGLYAQVATYDPGFVQIYGNATNMDPAFYGKIPNWSTLMANLATTQTQESVGSSVSNVTSVDTGSTAVSAGIPSPAPYVAPSYPPYEAPSPPPYVAPSPPPYEAPSPPPYVAPSPPPYVAPSPPPYVAPSPPPYVAPSPPPYVAPSPPPYVAPSPPPYVAPSPPPYFAPSPPPYVAPSPPPYVAPSPPPYVAPSPPPYVAPSPPPYVAPSPPPYVAPSPPPYVAPALIKQPTFSSPARPPPPPPPPPPPVISKSPPKPPPVPVTPRPIPIAAPPSSTSTFARMDKIVAKLETPAPPPSSISHAFLSKPDSSASEQMITFIDTGPPKDEGLLSKLHKDVKTVAGKVKAAVSDAVHDTVEAFISSADTDFETEAVNMLVMYNQEKIIELAHLEGEIDFPEVEALKFIKHTTKDHQTNVYIVKVALLGKYFVHAKIAVPNQDMPDLSLSKVLGVVPKKKESDKIDPNEFH